MQVKVLQFIVSGEDWGWGSVYRLLKESANITHMHFTALEEYQFPVESLVEAAYVSKCLET
jgi:hypothetical protein